MTRIALLRHGHTPWNRAGRIQGRSDIALDADAAADLSKLTLPAPWDKADLWSSPLQRASHTAELITGRVPKVSDALIEMDWGVWEGQRGTDLIADPKSGYRHIEHWGWDFRPPMGESPKEVWQRLSPWLEALSEDCVTVCHIGIMRVILARAWGWAFAGDAPFRIKRNRLYIVDLDQMRPEPEPVRLIPKADT